METAIYVRVSTEEQAQEGYSIRAQEQKLKDFARIKDWSIYKIYMDEGISGKNITQRPAINEMLGDVRQGKVENVVVFKIDRLTRSMADLIYLVDLFNRHGCAFNSLMESIDTQTASGRMFLKIVGIFAEFERENLIERIQLGVERKVKEGYALCKNIASYGYDRPNGQKIQTMSCQSAGLSSSLLPGSTSAAGFGKIANAICIPRSKWLNLLLSHHCLEDAKQVLSVREIANYPNALCHFQ